MIKNEQHNKKTKNEKTKKYGTGWLIGLVAMIYLDIPFVICMLVGFIQKETELIIGAGIITAILTFFILKQIKKRNDHKKEFPELYSGVDLSIYVNQIKELTEENQLLKKENSCLNESMTPELKNIVDAKLYLKSLEARIEELSVSIDTLQEEEIWSEIGLHMPKYDFATSDIYKEKLIAIREREKQLKNRAVTGDSNWTVNGSKSEGKKMINDLQKLILRAFNYECNGLIDKVRYNNYESSKSKMAKSREDISKLGRTHGIAITEEYFNLKLEELDLAYGYYVKKEEEKEAKKEEMERLKEERAVLKQIQEQRDKALKEQQHYEQAVQALQSQIDVCDMPDEALLKKKEELEEQLASIKSDIKNLDYREGNQKAGYVYIISNIGSFGKNVYKIGMTRRINPEERIDELSGASVPFKFDVHALIFSSDAPALEAALHRAFENKKVNMVNTRKEFFNVTLDEIKTVVRANFDKTVEFIDEPDAEQYYESIKLRKEKM